MIAIVRDNECINPRLQTYEKYLGDEGIPYRFYGWNRKGTAVQDEHHYFFQHPAEYGKKVQNIPNKLKWMRYVYRELKKESAAVSLIHACDIDAAIPAYLICKRYNKKLIFDVCDWISNEKDNNIFFWAIERAENYLFKRADYAIICEKERKEQAKTSNEHLLVMPNIPYREYRQNANVISEISSRKIGYRLVVGYVGVFDYNRGLEDLVEAAGRTPDVLLEIAGYGALQAVVENSAKKYTNIHYWGPVDYDVGQSVLSQTDMIAAMYYMSNPVHKYAAPNKYYESLKLGKPIITTEGTLVGKKVKQYGTGFVIAEGRDAILSLLNSRNAMSQLQRMMGNSVTAWNDIYRDYIPNFLNQQYGVICAEAEKQ